MARPSLGDAAREGLLLLTRLLPPDTPAETARLTGVELPAGTVTFVFTDIEGSTRLFQRLGDAYAAVLEHHNSIIREVLTQWRGVEVKTQGDSFFIAFSDPADAVAGCAAIQIGLSRHDWPGGSPIRVRIGMHTGEARVVGRDYVALAVHQAARVESAAHGGQVLLSSATAHAIDAALPENCALIDLGEYRLKDFDEPQRLYQLRHPDLAVAFPAPRAPSAAATNLPRARTSFIGREDILTKLHKAVADNALVTLVGAGGLGKTRTALQVAAESVVAFPDGVWLVELASVSDPALLTAAVADALSIRPEPNQMLADAIVGRLAPTKSLIVVDNCEHLIVDIALLVDDLLGRCSDLTILATSREPLRLADEQVVRLGSMSAPDPSTVGTTRSLLEHESVRLFVARASRASDGFVLTDQQATAVASICARLDGIPLAIELAAARVGELQPEEITAALDDRFAVLTEGLRSARPRQQTLRATLDWSFDLLSDAERVVLRRLGIFAGDFDGDSAAALVGAAPITPSQVADLLSDLAHRSMVEVENNTDDIRYRLLETVRAYANEHLDRAGETRLLEQRHFDHFFSLAMAAEQGMAGASQVETYARLEADYADFRASLAFGLSPTGDAGRVSRMAAALTAFWDLHGHLDEGQLWLGRALEANAEPTSVRARVLVGLGHLAVTRGALAEARSRYLEAVEISETIGDIHAACVAGLGLGNMLMSLGEIDGAASRLLEVLSTSERVGDIRTGAGASMALGIVARVRGDYSEALSRYNKAAEYASLLGDQRTAANASLNSGNVAWTLGDYVTARASYERTLAIARTLGARQAIVIATICLGGVAEHEGDNAAAQAFYEEGRVRAEELGDEQNVGLAMLNLGNVARHAGDHALASSYLAPALNVLRRVADASNAAWATVYLANTEQRSGRAAEARRLLAEGLTAAGTLGAPDLLAQALEFHAEYEAENEELARAVTALGAADAIRNLAGIDVPPPERFAHDALLGRLRAALNPSAFEDAWDAGRALSPAAAVSTFVDDAVAT